MGEVVFHISGLSMQNDPQRDGCWSQCNSPPTRHQGDQRHGMSRNVFIGLSLCHELIGDGLQQHREVVLGADEVSLTGSGRLRRWGSRLTQGTHT